MRKRRRKKEEKDERREIDGEKEEHELMEEGEKKKEEVEKEEGKRYSLPSVGWFPWQHQADNLWRRNYSPCGCDNYCIHVHYLDKALLMSLE